MEGLNTHKKMHEKQISLLVKKDDKETSQLRFRIGGKNNLC